MELLHVDASIQGDSSVSRQLAAAIVDRLTKNSASVEVHYRDLVGEGLSHLTFASLPGDHPLSTMAGELNNEALTIRKESQAMLDEFLAADVVVVGAPMYNFTIPSQLKAWIDRIVVPGKTFGFGPNGPIGLAGNKRIIVALARGGFYGAETASASSEHAESYLRTVFGFIGVTNLEFVIAEGLQAGEEQKATALASARQATVSLAA